MGMVGRAVPHRWLLVAALTVAAAGLLRTGCGAGAHAQQPREASLGRMLELRVLDVGQNDAVLIRHAGKSVLVDAGEGDVALVRLRELGVEALDLLVASHNDADHIGGMDALLLGLPVAGFLDNGHPTTTRIQRRVLDLVESRGVTYLSAVPRTVWLDSVALHVVPSPLEGRNVRQNDRSVTLLVERGAFRALLTGDSERRLLAALLRGDGIRDVDVLKAPHHGSDTGVLAPWLARTRPEVVLISVGAGNPYGHPHPTALAAYEGAGARVFRTDRDGDLVVTVDASGCYEVRAARTADSPFRGGPASCAAPDSTEGSR